MTDQELLKETLRLLNGLPCEYMLTGSMASNYWGIPRTTHDLDFVIHIERRHMEAFAEAFEKDFYIDLETMKSAFKPPYQFNAIDRRSAMKVHFWTAGTTAFDRSVFARCVAVTLFGEPAIIATAEDVLLHKLYWHRITPSERQVLDAAGIIAVQKDNLDLPDMKH